MLGSMNQTSVVGIISWQTRSIKNKLIEERCWWWWWWIEERCWWWWWWIEERCWWWWWIEKRCNWWTMWTVEINIHNISNENMSSDYSYSAIYFFHRIYTYMFFWCMNMHSTGFLTSVLLRFQCMYNEKERTFWLKNRSKPFDYIEVNQTHLA